MSCRRSILQTLFVFLLAIGSAATGGDQTPVEMAPGTSAVSSPAADIDARQIHKLFTEQHSRASERPAKGAFVPKLGNYFDTANPGWGLDIQALDDLLFAIWFTYLPDGSPTWYIIVGELTAKGAGMSLTGGIDSFKWDPFGTPGDQATATSVGTMTIDWTDESNATVSWTLDGDPGNAAVSFAAFAPGLAFADLTGHYFPRSAPGWGFTLLTQGDVTVLTLYWYKNGQPVWAQGVTTTPGFNHPAISLLLFDAPNLCPGCLDKQEDKGFSTQELTDVIVYYTPGVPPEVMVGWPGVFSKGGPLGSNPFDDIPLGVDFITASAITSAFGDNFDPTYADFGALIAGLDLGTNCLPFEYNDGVWDATIEATFTTAYFLLEPTPEGGLPVYTDAGCTKPFLYEGVFGTLPTQIMGAGTGSDAEKGDTTTEALQVSWGATFPEVAGDNCDLYDGATFSGGRWVSPASVSIRLYGVTRGDRVLCDDGYGNYFPYGGWVLPPPGAEIGDGTESALTIKTTY